MYLTQHHRLERELLKWLVLFLGAGLILLLSTRPTSGGAPDRQQVWLHQDALGIGERLRTPTAKCIWTILEAHAAGRHELAIVQWQLVSLSEEVDVWRTVSIGSTRTQLGQLDQAASVVSGSQHDDHAVVNHLRGVIDRLRACIAQQQGRPAEARRYLDSARTHFNASIDAASKIDMEATLCTPAHKFVSIRRYTTIHPNRMLPPSTPTVRDLLSILRLEDFELKSHIGLAEINLSDGKLLEAESNLDDADRTGGDVAGLYSDLGRAYERRGDEVDATRAYLKAFSGGEKKAEPLFRALRSLRKAL